MGSYSSAGSRQAQTSAVPAGQTLSLCSFASMWAVSVHCCLCFVPGLQTSRHNKQGQICVFHANHFCFLTYKTMMILKLFAVKKHGHVRNSGKKLGLVEQQKITWRIVCCLWQMRWNELSVPDLFHFLSPLTLLEKAVMGRIITLFKSTSFKYLWGRADKASIQTLQAHTCPCSMWKQPLKQLLFFYFIPICFLQNCML